MKYLDTDSVRLSNDENSVIIIDQTKLPSETVYLSLNTAEEIFDAIKLLKVRGAPAIGICAGYAVYVLAKQMRANSKDELVSRIQKIAEYLGSSRPTAVNLNAALSRMTNTLCNAQGNVCELLEILKAEAVAIHEEDIAMCRRIAKYGLTLVKSGDGILTHCNAGALATSRYGTGLGALLLGKEKGYDFKVYVDETRPLLQGARLTAFELDRAGIDVTLVCDNMAGYLMSKGYINAVFVGCDRVAVNGDTANKIGTLSAAVLAKHFCVPFYVFCPSTTIDYSIPDGNAIPIEMRNGEEIRSMFCKRSIAPDVKCLNPAFDVTPAELITAIVTDRGICRPPYTVSLSSLIC